MSIFSILNHPWSFRIKVNYYFQVSFSLKLIFVCGQNNLNFCDFAPLMVLSAVNLTLLKIGHLRQGVTQLELCMWQEYYWLNQSICYCKSRRIDAQIILSFKFSYNFHSYTREIMVFDSTDLLWSSKICSLCTRVLFSPD